MSRTGDSTPRNSLRHARDLTIDVTNTGVVAEAAQLAVDELQSALGGGPWSVLVESTGEVLAASGPLDADPGRVVPLPAAGLGLVAVERSEGGIDDGRFRSTVERIGRLLGAVGGADTRPPDQP